MHASSFTRPVRARLGAVLAGAILTAFTVVALAGCGSNGAADPLLAARVNGAPITMAQYDGMLRFTSANAAVQGHLSDLQSPTGRQNFNSVGQGAMDWLVSEALAKQELAAQKLKVTADERKSAQDMVDNFKAQVQQQLEMQPGNPQMQDLMDSMTPDVHQNLVDRLTNEQALADQGMLPYAHLRAIFADTQSDANNYLTQVQQGADFGTLARDHSTDSQTAAVWGDLGNVFVGQNTPDSSVGQLTSALQTHVFAPNAHPAKDFVVPASNGYALVEIMQQGKGQLPAAQRASLGITVAEAWLANVVQPNAGLDQYVALK
ncbi:MAG TPA: SurA N-terminal domain-containing protein [Ktedonobacterales bacterium]